jgi:pimeloyl-ACP methyl ester carboxylesterase
MKTISISTPEGLLEADYFEGGPHWVLLCHGKVFSKGDWGELPNQLHTDDQRSVLSLNFSGYGASVGDQDPTLYPRNIDAALLWITKQQPETISILGASMGAVAIMDWACTAESSVTLQNTVLFAPRSAQSVQIPTSNLYGVFNDDEEDALAHIARLEDCFPTVQIHRLSGHLHAQNNLLCEQATDAVRLLRSLLIGS